MKLMVTILLTAGCMAASAQELHVGNRLPEIKITNMINGPGKNLSVGQLKGKVTIIDFWATWCSPCVSALGKLEQYKRQFGDKLVVLALSDEATDRLKQFIHNRPVGLLVSNDTAAGLQRIFPHRIIPHTVLIGLDGKIKAITDPDNITPEIIELALNNAPFDLPLKNDRINFSIEEYFKADTTVEQSFRMLPPVEGFGSMSRMYPAGFFKDRRMTMVNMTMDGLYRLAYDRSYYLLKNEYDTTVRSYKDEKKYCVDFWLPVGQSDQLLPYFQQKLKEQFLDVEAVPEIRKMKVLVVKADSTARQKLKSSLQSNNRFNAGGSHFEGNGVGLQSLAEYMEDFGLYAGKVMDETGLTGRYDIFFEWQPEKPASLKAAFASLGLYWEIAEREVEILVLKNKSNR
jgi:uncharacterized protein (TIGR03435 family)